jgi:transcriptional regulator with XRE-family HTH domain
MIHLSHELSPSERLRRAREQAGYPTAADFARDNNIKKTTYQHHENGRRELTPDVARLYGRILKLPAGSLLFGERVESLQRNAPVIIVGRVTAQGRITPVDNQDTIILPDPTQLLALRIESDDMIPNYRLGDTIFFQRLVPDRFDLEDLTGVECVVELADGRQLLRQVSVQIDGRVTLAAYHAPMMVDQVVVAASPVEIVQRVIPAPRQRNRWESAA